jgi:hypothetical protein
MHFKHFKSFKTFNPIIGLKKFLKLLENCHLAEVHFQNKWKYLVMGTGNPWVLLTVPVPIPAKTPTLGWG